MEYFSLSERMATVRPNDTLWIENSKKWEKRPVLDKVVCALRAHTEARCGTQILVLPPLPKHVVWGESVNPSEPLVYKASQNCTRVTEL